MTIPNGDIHMLNEDEVESYMLGDKFLYASRQPRAMTFQTTIEDEMRKASNEGDEVISKILEEIPTYSIIPNGHLNQLIMSKKIKNENYGEQNNENNEINNNNEIKEDGEECLIKLTNSSKQEELIEACKIGHLKLIAMLLDADAQVNYRDPQVL